MRYFIMSVGADGEPAPDRWITDWGWDNIEDSHLCNWWSPHRIHTPWTGDIVVQASIITGKILGIFRMTGPGEPHTYNPDRWPHGIALEPLLTWDLRYAPTLESTGLGRLTITYHKVDEEHEPAMLNLINAYLPELYIEIMQEEAA